MFRLCILFSRARIKKLKATLLFIITFKITHACVIIPCMYEHTSSMFWCSCVYIVKVLQDIKYVHVCYVINVHTCVCMWIIAVDCQLGDWEDWEECNTQCGRGVMTRRRQVLVEARNGGKPCGAVSERRLCWGSNCKVARSNVGVEEMRGN